MVSTAGASVDAVVDATDKRIHMSDVFLTAIRAYNDDLLAAIGAYFTRGESVLSLHIFATAGEVVAKSLIPGITFMPRHTGQVKVPLLTLLTKEMILVVYSA